MPPSYRSWLWTLALVGLVLDQATKYGVFFWLRDAPDNKQVIIPGAFNLVAQRLTGPGGQEVLHVNHGALFGWLQGWEGRANTGFAVISLVAAAAIVVWSSQRSTARDRGLCVALGLILAGTLGNFYDRVFFGGVRDFLHWYYWVNWPVFNVADCCLVVGALLLLVLAFRSQPAEEQKSADTNVVAGKSAEATTAV
jgi:signal peptidase II